MRTRRTPVAIVLAAWLMCLPARAEAERDLAAARTVFDQGDYLSAEHILRTYLQSHPESAEAMYLLAYTQQRENQPRESLATYNLAAKLIAPDGEQLRRVSLDYVLLDDYPDASRWLERAVSASPNNADAWYDLGRVRMHDGRFDLAIDALDRSLSIRPGNSRALGNLGKCLENQNRVDAALEAYAAAVKAANAEPKPLQQPYVDFAALLNTRNRFAEALPLLDHAVKASPGDAHAWEERGRAQAGLGQITAAVTSLERAVALDPANPRLHFQLGKTYKLAGKAEQAQGEYAKSAALYGGKSSD